MHNAVKLRKLYGKTQEEISDLIDYPKPLYAAFEIGKYKIPKVKLSALAKVYNVSFGYIVNGDDDCYRDD